MQCLSRLGLFVALVLAGFGIWLWSGSYDIGADAPHWGLTRSLIGVLREHSIDHRLATVGALPNLKDPALIAEGARHYAGMCTGCHLAPDMHDSEMREGLYPQPPDLTRFAPNPVKAFWIIKHGIKMSGMPAWGKTHDDQKIWAMVAFLQQQPKLSVAQYRALSAGGEDDDDDHPQAAAAPAAMPGMVMPAPATSAGKQH